MVEGHEMKFCTLLYGNDLLYSKFNNIDQTVEKLDFEMPVPFSDA